MNRSDFPVLARAGQHYLDNAAMAQCPVQVVRAVMAHEGDGRANIRRGLYALARRADEAYDHARERVAVFLGAEAGEVVFTGGCTQALNLAARALSRRLGPGDEVVTSRLEHHSSCLPWMALAAEKGFALRWLEVTAEGRLDLSNLDAVITPRCKVVAVTHASNVTGAVSDIPRLAEAAHGVGALLLVDGAQMVPHGAVHPRALGADLYAFAGHKVYGPTGIGVLWGQREVLAELEPVSWGGGMVDAVEEKACDWAEPPFRFEAGTPPVAQAVGLATALDWVGSHDWEALATRQATVTRLLLEGLREVPGLRLIGPAGLEDRVPVVSFVIPGFHPHDLAHLLAERGVAVRGGHHCARPLMAALGLAEGSLRVSLAPYNDRTDIEALLSALDHALKVLG